MIFQAVDAPQWLYTNAIYQINPRTFSEEGTISAVTERLEELKSLGFYTLYLCPVFEEDESSDSAHWSERQKKYKTNNPKNSYRIKNYFHIDEEYGTMDDLREFIDKAHSLNMRVLLDLVYMHLGPSAPVIKKHPEFAAQDQNGNIVYNEYHFIELDFKSAGLREYLYSNMLYYLIELDADGFRCDAADLIPNDFWAEMRRRMKSAKNDAVLINEGSKLERLADSFDACYGFAWHCAMYDMLTGKKTVRDFIATYNEIKEKTPKNGLLLRDYENHDTVTDWPVRGEILFGNDGMELITAVNYAIDGIPMVYCGNEIADTARVNMFANRFFKGEYEATRRDKCTGTASVRRREIIKNLNKMLRESPALQLGETLLEHSSNESQIVSFSRVFEKERIFFAGNFSKIPAEAKFENLPSGEILCSNHVNISQSSIKLEAYGYIIIKEEKQHAF